MNSILRTTLLMAILMISACSKVESDWNQAAADNTIAAYENHIAGFPDSPHAVEARSAITQLEWQAARDANTIDAVEQFITTHPGAPQLDSATAALDELRAEMREADVADMGEKLRAFLDGDESKNVIARLGSQEFVPRRLQPQSNIVVNSGSRLMAVIGGAAQVAYVAGDNNTVASVEDYQFAIGAPIEMTNGNSYIWRDGAWEAN